MGKTYNLRAFNIAEEVLDERARQDAKWGEQNHPDGTGRTIQQWLAESARSSCQAAAEQGTVTWAHILTEEFWEALAESDPAKLRAELIQVAAVANAWAEAIDRRQAHECDPTCSPASRMYCSPICEAQGRARA